MSEPTPPTLLVDVLEKKFPESTRTSFRTWIADKRVLIDGRIARTLKQEIAHNATVTVVDRGAARARTVGPLPVQVVHEDADLLVIDKPAGLITSSGPKDQRDTLANLLVDYYAALDPRIAIGLVHRLDRDASGLLVFSKNPTAFERLTAQFNDKSAGRTYRAIVTGEPKPLEGKIESKLVELADGTVRTTRHRDHGEQAITHYKTLQQRGQHALLEVRLETGRKHQIRAHLSERDCPIAGDVLYHQHANQAPRLMLVASELTLVHPRTGRETTWSVELPEEMTTWWAAQKKK